MINLLGVLSGLWAAFFQSLSYLATRQFLHSRTAGTRLLMTLAHIWMGAISLAALCFIFPSTPVPWGNIALPLFCVAFFYLLGQFGMIWALRYAQPSQAAPMLALKLLVLAGLAIAVRHQIIHPMQWASIACCLLGTFLLNYTPDRMPTKALLALLCTCLFFGLSDWSIGYLIPAFGEHIPPWQKIANASLMCYGACGLLAVAFLPFYGSRKWVDWRDSLPYSVAWLIAILGLFTCFALKGVILGNILQNTRSIMGVFLAALLTHAGHTHIEHIKDPETFVRRLAASVLMTLAAVLWFVA